jgi:hypothetical protein
MASVAEVDGGPPPSSPPPPPRLQGKLPSTDPVQPWPDLALVAAVARGSGSYVWRRGGASGGQRAGDGLEGKKGSVVPPTPTPFQRR